MMPVVGYIKIMQVELFQKIHEFKQITNKSSSIRKLNDPAINTKKSLREFGVPAELTSFLPMM